MQRSRRRRLDAAEAALLPLAVKRFFRVLCDEWDGLCGVRKSAFPCEVSLGLRRVLDQLDAGAYGQPAEVFEALLVALDDGHPELGARVRRTFAGALSAVSGDVLVEAGNG